MASATRKQITGPTKAVVNKRAKQVRAQVIVTGTTTNDSVTVAQLMAEYLEAVEPNVRPRTIEQYVGWSERYIIPNLGKRKVSSLTPVDVRNFHKQLRELGHSTNTIRSARRVLRQALGQAERDGYVVRNVAKVQGRPRDEGDTRKVEPLNEIEAAVVLEAVEGWRYEALVYLLIGCGLPRRGSTRTPVGQRRPRRWRAAGDRSGVRTSRHGQDVGRLPEDQLIAAHRRDPRDRRHQAPRPPQAHARGEDDSGRGSTR